MEPSVDQVRAVLVDTQALYRSRVFDSWVFEYLSGRYLAGAIKSGGLGYAPKVGTMRWLAKRGHSLEAMVAAGVVRQTDAGPRDVMRDRLMFPVFDSDNVLAGFLGRARPGNDKAPKYLNTPATSLYKKSRILYGLGPGSERLRSGGVPVIVEGPMDKLAVDKLGSRFVGLAACGTAFTSSHMQSLVDVCDSAPVFCFDGDQAGRKALLKSWEALKSFGRRSYRAVVLEAGQDPASLHPKVLERVLSSAQPMSVVVSKTCFDGLPNENNVIRAIYTARDAARLVADQIVVDDVTAWISEIAQTSELPIESVNNILIHAISPEPEDPQAIIDRDVKTETQRINAEQHARSIADKCFAYPPEAAIQNMPAASNEATTYRRVNNNFMAYPSSGVAR